MDPRERMAPIGACLVAPAGLDSLQRVDLAHSLRIGEWPLFAHLRRLRRRLVSTLTGHRGSRLWTSQLGDSGFNEKPRRWRRGPGQVGGRRPIRLAPWRKEPEIARQTSGRMKTKWQNSKGRYRQSRDVEDESGERCSQAVWLSQNHGEGVSRWRSQFGFVPTPLAARGNPARLPERR